MDLIAYNWFIIGSLIIFILIDILKKEIETKYLSLSEKLNYSYFSEDFLLKYFD
jgi:hypothetical protein